MISSLENCQNQQHDLDKIDTYSFPSRKYQFDCIKDFAATRDSYAAFLCVGQHREQQVRTWQNDTLSAVDTTVAIQSGCSMSSCNNFSLLCLFMGYDQRHDRTRYLNQHLRRRRMQPPTIPSMFLRGGMI